MRRALGLAAALVVALAHPTAAQSTPPARPGSGYALVLASALNIRERPALDARVVAVAARGERLCVLRVEADWVEVGVRASVGGPAGTAPPARGWVSRGFVSTRAATPEELRGMGCVPPS